MEAIEGWKGSTRGWQIVRADMARRGRRSDQQLAGLMPGDRSRGRAWPGESGVAGGRGAGYRGLEGMGTRMPTSGGGSWSVPCDHGKEKGRAGTHGLA
jgi:hypothetical protein